jgi:transcriptional regulator with XRE-family HTH domain
VELIKFYSEPKINGQGNLPSKYIVQSSKPLNLFYMATLKELRIQFQMTQGEVSKRTGINVPTLSNYESGNVIPMLEDILAIDKAFGQHVEWEETNNPELKEEINILLNHYPTVTVVNFLARWLRTDVSYGARMVKTFAILTQKVNEQPLYPSEVNNQ